MIGKAPIDVADLGHVAEECSRLGRRLAADRDLALRRSQQAGDRLEQRALARTVAADDAGEDAAGDVQREVLKDAVPG